MDEPAKYQIDIYNVPNWVTWLRRIVGLFLLLIVPIGVGVVVNSPAMQWVGFVVVIIVVIALANESTKNNRFTTIAAARARLDQIERGEI